MAQRSHRPPFVFALWVVIAGVLATGAALAQDPAPPDAATAVTLTVEPREATVGEVLRATLVLDLAADTKFTAPNLGASLGPFSVIDGGWAGPLATADGVRWTWTAGLAAYRTGEQELPAVSLAVERDGETLSLSSAPLTVNITSVLPALAEGEDEPTIAELKAPASIAPDYGPLRIALGILLALLLVSLVAWWLHRRYADRLAAAQVPDDPFHRVAPHVWVYGELQKLLERRLPEEGRIEEFYSELALILKRYLSGRFRVELLEQTTEELPPTLRQAGAGESSIHDTEDVLREADQVKFAKVRPGPAQWKAGVERVYRIVDRTKPVSVDPPAADERGAA